MIRQGDVCWMDVRQILGFGPGPHLFVVIQNDVLNSSRINSVIVCLITSSSRQFNIPTNVVLDVGEANLSMRSVVNVSQMFTVLKQDLGKKIGTLSEDRLYEILDNLHDILVPRNY